MDSLKREARTAGWLYLVVVLAGPFLLLYVPGKLFVAGDAAATAHNILAHETLYRASIAAGVVAELAFLFAVLALYRLLRRVDGQLAAVMAILIVLDVPLAFLGLANQAATLSFLRGAGELAVFEPPQREAIATLLIHFDRQGAVVSEVLWGLWLLPLGRLVFRSGFLPRLLGVWLAANGLAYLAISAIGLAWPGAHDRALAIATPVLFGEVALTFWLVTVGARVPGSGASSAVAPAA